MAGGASRQALLRLQPLARALGLRVETAHYRKAVGVADHGDRRAPPDVIAKLNKDLDGALQDQKVKETLHDMGAVIKGGAPEDFKNFIASETVKWTKIIEVANIKGE